MKDNIYRIIDANYNRIKEGLRVTEDIARFVLNDRNLTVKFKNTRHRITATLKTLHITQQDLIDSRSTHQDVGKKSSVSELSKKNIHEILYANLQRIKESVRVLEELSKLINKKSSIAFKNIRFKIYELEKEALKKITALSNN